MTPQQSIAAFGGIVTIAALAFFLAWTLRSRKIRELTAWGSLRDRWLDEANVSAAGWRKRRDDEQVARENDASQLAAVIDTLKAREGRLTQEYNEKIETFRKRVEAAEKWVPKRGNSGKFSKK